MNSILLQTFTGPALDAIKGVLGKAGEHVFLKYKNFKEISSILENIGVFFQNKEKSEEQFFEDLKCVLSKKNLENIAKDLKNEDGYDLDYKLMKALKKLMREYEIPYEYAESYSRKIVMTFLEQIRVVEPDKYQRYFLQDWRKEQDESMKSLQLRLDKMNEELACFNQRNIEIHSSGSMDMDLKRKTVNPSIGIEFFTIDDDYFKDAFSEKRYQRKIYISGRCREETIYCVLNELWQLDEKRPIFVVRNIESWERLRLLNTEGNVLIPWFYSDEIVAIDNNTNIFVLDENTPAVGKEVIELRPRTYNTIIKCLQLAGMDIERAYELVDETHGLYIPMKKLLFDGLFLKSPNWVSELDDKVKKICLLINSWEDIEGDRLVIETLYGNSYEEFMEELTPYMTGEDPFVHVAKRRGKTSYYLASTEISWEYVNVSIEDKIWKRYTDIVCNVLNEAETLFTYDYKDKLIAMFKGERLFWSETIRKGMLKALIMKGTYKPETDSQNALNVLIEKILNFVKTKEQWEYISTFWKEICEIAPEAVLDRLESEMDSPTGLMELFANQNKDVLFGRNAYIYFLWGIESFLVQKAYYWRGFRWLLKLDSKKYDYKSNSPKDTFLKIFCTWYNFSAIETPKEKMDSAEIALEESPDNAWNYIYEAVDSTGRSYVGHLSAPQYRECEAPRVTTKGAMHETYKAYVHILLSHMEFSVERWGKMLMIFGDLPDDLRKELLAQMLYEIKQMSDIELIQIKNSIRRLIYNHRHMSSAFWAMPEEKINQFEKLLNEIHATIPEYEYEYLFSGRDDCQLMHPISCDDSDNYEKNNAMIEEEIHKKLIEFKKEGYNLKILAEVCAKEKYSSLGKSLAKYWDGGKWDSEVFFVLLSVQESGLMAIDYMEKAINGDSLLYKEVIERLEEMNYSREFIAKVYRSEAFLTTKTPLVHTAPERIKELFWSNYIHCDKSNYKWAIGECKKYGSLAVYIKQLIVINYSEQLQPQELFTYFDDIEEMRVLPSEAIDTYDVKQLLEPLQKEYIDDVEKSIRISQIEMLFMRLLEWNDMKCFNKMIKSSAKLMADLVSIVFKKDNNAHDSIDSKSDAYVTNMYSLFDKAHFCPTEENNAVDEVKLEKWVEEFRTLLTRNNQASLFTGILGRLFSYSPIDEDGHEPCVAVRKMIEKYGDDKLKNKYIYAVFDRRGVYSPSAGREETRMSEAFRENGRFLEAKYPKTASIFTGLADLYQREAIREREEAENGEF